MLPKDAIFNILLSFFSISLSSIAILCLDAYINLRLEFIDSVMHKEIAILPEKKRELIRQRSVGRKIELRKLLILLKEDKIKDMSKKYFQKINVESDDGDEENVGDEGGGDKISEDDQTA